jgi:hypothetical protein
MRTCADTDPAGAIVKGHVGSQSHGAVVVRKPRGLVNRALFAREELTAPLAVRRRGIPVGGGDIELTECFIWTIIEPNETGKIQDEKVSSPRA